ncbi:FAD/FMN-containing dehydrogenases [hydrothermal vent metagenome]|uniref:FAD/FMN-containing dehydrogenases n=1 Tax=hydrothermal vent metagenome TaxID=652676 RepID=A0A1W1CWW1_9ZZZZ
MKNIILALIVAFAFLGCSSKSDENKNVEAKLVVGKSLLGVTLNDQHEKPQTISKKIKVVFFSFAKPTGHICNKFLQSKPANFLQDHHAFYVADVSPAPSLIKKMFILPDLKELKFPILLINDDKLSAEYSKGMNKEKIVVVLLKDGTITNIKNIDNEQALEKFLTKF